MLTAHSGGHPVSSGVTSALLCTAVEKSKGCQTFFFHGKYRISALNISSASCVHLAIFSHLGFRVTKLRSVVGNVYRKSLRSGRVELCLKT